MQKQNLRKLGILVALTLIVGVGSQIGQVFAQIDEQKHVKKTDFEREQKVKKTGPTEKSVPKTTDYEYEQKVKTNPHYADKVANVKTTFKLKQEIKNAQR